MWDCFERGGMNDFGEERCGTDFGEERCGTGMRF